MAERFRKKPVEVTAPFRDPVIYPGSPELVYPSAWFSLRSAHECVTGGELLRPGSVARYHERGLVCQTHDPVQSV